MSFLAANTQDGFGEHWDKNYPMCTMKYTAVLFMLWAYISAGGLDILFRHIASWIISNTNKTKLLLWPAQSSDLNPVEDE